MLFDFFLSFDEYSVHSIKTRRKRKHSGLQCRFRIRKINDPDAIIIIASPFGRFVDSKSLGDGANCRVLAYY
ncbi:MAG: hypothetical protein C5B59_09895 [Bacteroidetes bacterium]|nr:MAG: hypothetical protein C5B59_09895 [Bacteroidota bacterium]